MPSKDDSEMVEITYKVSVEDAKTLVSLAGQGYGHCPGCGMEPCICEGNDEWCQNCQNTGQVECLCGGDFCVCTNFGHEDCWECSL
jgi:hypothetical protein